MIVELVLYLIMFAIIYMLVYAFGLVILIPYWAPTITSFVLTTCFFLLFFRTDIMRRKRIKYLIIKNKLLRIVKHWIHDMIYIVRISALLTMLLYLIIFVGIIALIIASFYLLYNQFIVNMLGGALNLKPVTFSPSSLLGTLFSGRTNPLYAIGFLFGTALSAFLRPKLEKFIEKVKTKKTLIYVFGSNEITRHFIESICAFGFGPLLALIAEKERPWMDKYRSIIDLLVVDDPEVLKDPTVYSKIGFQNAINVLILVDDRELAQHILLNIRKTNPNVQVLLLSRNKPPILDVVGEHLKNIKVIDDIDITNRELVRQISLGFVYANAVETIIPREYIGKTPNDLESDFNFRLKVLGVKRGDLILLPDKFEAEDIVILYLHDPKALREFLQLLPISPFEEIKPIQTTQTKETIEGGESGDRDKAS